METINQLEVLTECEEYLQFIENIFERSNIKGFGRVEVRQQIRRIRQRYNDPNLYLAVIGEFSSGKSTFINALLRDELLKTSFQPTTGVATRMSHGSQLEVEVQFKDHQKPKIKVNSKEKEITLAWLPEIKGINIRKFIEIITSYEDVTKQIRGITITHPSIANDLVIIDTPGTNAADNPEHSAITTRVVQEEADLAIIIVPATIPLSDTLANFLASSLQPYLHRCIFVVSRMDEIRAKEQSRLLQNLRSRLVDKLNISPPQLYACSPQIVLDMLNGDELESEQLAVWQERFTKLEKIIIDRLNRERIISISESLLRLLNQLFQQLNSYLRSQSEQLGTRQSEIKQESITNLAEFSVEQYASCENQLKNSISTYLSKTANCVDSHRESAINKIRTHLFGVETEDALKMLLQSKMETFLKEEQQRLQSDLQSLTQNLVQDAIAVGKIFERKISEVYRRLQYVRGTVEATANTSYNFQSSSSNVTISAQSLTQSIDSSNEAKMGLGATAGSVIGTVLLPGVGTVVGLAVGSWASRFFCPSLDERKQKIWEELKPSLNSYFDRVKTQSQESATNCTRKLEASLKEQIDSYIQQYKLVIDKISQKQKNELDSLNELQELTKADLNEIERRQKRLYEKQKKLAAINF
jgi:GTPase Era involved in 16S rRNA processing/gas vesicle protein